LPTLYWYNFTYTWYCKQCIDKLLHMLDIVKHYIDTLLHILDVVNIVLIYFRGNFPHLIFTNIVLILFPHAWYLHQKYWRLHRHWHFLLMYWFSILFLGWGQCYFVGYSSTACNAPDKAILTHTRCFRGFIIGQSGMARCTGCGEGTPHIALYGVVRTERVFGLRAMVLAETSKMASRRA
jgi:hypothetical protein